MTLNKQVGNMYPFVTHTINFIKGRCPYQCSYCYYQANPYYKDKIGKLHLDEKALFDDLGEHRTIFVGSSTDMWAEEVPNEWIERVLETCRGFNNTYLFQSKNPVRFTKFIFPTKTILGTTIESNRDYKLSQAPRVVLRWRAIKIKRGWNRMVSIEPILDFDLEEFVKMIKEIDAKFVSIGADSQGHNLPEPSPEKVKALIDELKKFTEVKIKPNLNRIIGDIK